MEEFFPKKRRRLDIVRPALKRNAQNEKRIAITLSMPLEGDNLSNVPDYIDKAFTAVGTENSPVDKAHVATELDAMNVRFYQLSDTDGPEKAVDLKLMGALLTSFVVSRQKGKGDTPRTLVSLDFKLTIPFRPAIWAWAGENAGATMFAEFEMTQQTFDLAKANEDEDDGQEEMSFETPGHATDGSDYPDQPAENAAAVTATEGEFEEGTATEISRRGVKVTRGDKRATRAKAKKAAKKKKKAKR